MSKKQERCFVCDVILSTNSKAKDTRFKNRQTGRAIAGGKGICAACNAYELAARLNKPFVKALGFSGWEFDKHNAWDKISQERQKNTTDWLEEIAVEMNDQKLTFSQIVGKLGQMKKWSHENTGKHWYFRLPIGR